ncbi:MAG: CHAT domain-containing protein [Candidatus Helarchaeota archaeon]
MDKPIQLHIDKINGSYLFKVQHPVLAQLKSFKRLDVANLRQRIIVQVDKIRNNIFTELTNAEQMHQDLISIGNSIQDLVGENCTDSIQDLLKNHPSLLFLTDDPYIPWELLTYREGPLCLTNSMGRIITGMSLKAEYKKSEKEVIQILFIADPVGDLPSARLEIQNILKEIKPAIDSGYIEPIILEGNNATTSKIIEIMRQHEIEIIHYAGHAFFNDAAPEASGLVLADKVLTAQILSKTLNYVPEIIFVNACESAQTASNYDKISGVAQGFIEAGIKIFIGSLWPIDDRDAANFSFSFYHNLLQEKTIGECILASKKELFAQKSTYGWASFILYGNPNEKPYLFNQEFKNKVENEVIPVLREPIKLRFKKDEALLSPVQKDPERQIIPMGIEEDILKTIQSENFSIILGPPGIGKTNCKYLLSQNTNDIFLVEFNKNYMKALSNSEALSKIRTELELLANQHQFVVLVIDEELYCSDMQASNLIEIVGLLFPSGQPEKMIANLRLILFLRTKSFKELWKNGKIPAHWRIHQIWLHGIKLSDETLNGLLALHNLSEKNFTKPAYELLKQKISSRNWIYPLFADKLLLFLEKNYQEQFNADNLEEIRISDEIIESIRNLVYQIRAPEQKQVWDCIVNLNKTFRINPPLWLIKTTFQKLNTEILNLQDIIEEFIKEKLILEESDEILGNTYLFSHDIYYEIIKGPFDEEFALDLIESIEENLNKNLLKIKTVKNSRKLEMYLHLILQRFYFLSVNPFGAPAEYIDEVLEYCNNLDLKVLAKVISYLKLLVIDFYARNQVESVAKLYFFIGDYYVKIDDIQPATDFYNMGAHIFESQGEDATLYRIKNGNLYETRIIPQLDLNDFDSQTTVELASWQWKAAKEYKKGIETRKLLVETYLKNDNKTWAAADLQWCGEVAELNGQHEESLAFYKEAVRLLESEENQIFNVIAYLMQISILLTKLNRDKEKEDIEAKKRGLEKKINLLQKGDGKKIYILSGGGDLFPANQIHYKILQEIPAEVVIKDETPSEQYDIIITFGSPLTPKVGPLIYNYMDREIINKMLSSSGYWIKQPTQEGEALIIAIAGRTMFHTRAEAETFIQNENFKDLINLI